MDERRLAGVDGDGLPLGEGVKVSPCDYEGIPSATVSHVSPFGEIKVDFKREAGKTTYTVTVPANTVGYFRKGGLNETMGSGVHTFTLEA